MNKDKSELEKLSEEIFFIEKEVNVLRTALDVAKRTLEHQESIPFLEEDISNLYKKFISKKIEFKNKSKYL